MGADIDFVTEGSGLSKHRAVVVTKRDAGANAAWDANLDLEFTENWSTGTLGTLGTQKFATSSGSPNNIAIDIPGVDALSLSPLERERSVPSVPCVPAPEILEQNVGRNIEASVPCVPAASVPPAFHSVSRPGAVAHIPHTTHAGDGVVQLSVEVRWIVAEAQQREDSRHLLLVDVRANRRAWIVDPSEGVYGLGDILNGVASVRPDGSTDVAITGMWS
ncbi:MAG: hypothetical protein ACHREM_13665 [Polyangiales bacterium]